MAVSPCCKRSLKSFSEILCRSSKTATPTLATVARLANVSVASASRALNGIKTNPETLQRVREAAEAVGYVPNAAARCLRSRRTGQIAFAMPDVANPVYTTMVGSIQEVARSHGSRLLLHSTEGDVADELGFLADLRQRFVDGLILCSLEFTTAHAEAVVGAAVPVVVIGKPTKGAQVDTVRANSRRGAADAVRHLHGAGRRRIGLVNGPRAHGARARRGGSATSTACAPASSSATTRSSRRPTTSRSTPGREAVERLLARARPDAIFCANDLLALGALSALRDGRPRRAARRRGRRHGQHDPLGRHLAAADDGRPRLGRARAHRRRAAARAHRAPRAPRADRRRRAAPRRPRLVRSAGMTTVPEPRRLIRLGKRPRRRRGSAGVGAQQPRGAAPPDPGDDPDRRAERGAARARHLPRLHRLARRPRRAHALHRARQLPAPDPRRPLRQLVQDRR